MTRRFTGWHMLAIMLSFFGIVIVVNLTMARFAIHSFSGTVVANSYVASQEFNDWLAAARAQRALGWQTQVSLNADRHVVVTLANAPAGVGLIGIARHPLGRGDDVRLSFARQADASLISTRALPAGRWHVMMTARAGTEIVKLAETLQ